MHRAVWPTEKNNHKAWLIRRPVLIILSILLLLFNTFTISEPVNAAIDVYDLLELHNQQRESQGLLPLKINENLNLSAQNKALAMLESDCWSHYCPDGKSPWDFFYGAGYNYSVAGENLAEGFKDSNDVVIAWMNSPTHRENILKAEYEEVGFGIVTGNFQGKNNNVVVAVHFGTPSGVSTEEYSIDNPNKNINAPEILSPDNESWVGQNELNLLGASNGASLVEIYNYDNLLAITDTSQDEFKYSIFGIEDGRYELSTVGKTGIRESGRSASTTVFIDTKYNEINSNQITVYKNSSDRFEIRLFDAELDNIWIAGNNMRIDFINSGNNIWVAELPKSESTQLRINTIDKAGNSWSGDLDYNILLAKANDLPQLSPDIAGLNTVKSSVNLIFLILLTLLFLIDFVVLQRTGNTKEYSSKHNHLGILLIVVIVLITGTFGGHILNGITL